jgi:UDP-3-O-[3-hydroxymyristoyl] glucosamine N-acyltransferase
VEVRLDELAASLGGDILSGSGGLIITGLDSLADAREGDLSFFGNEKYLAQFRRTRASAVLVPRRFEATSPGPALLAVDNPSHAFGEVMARFAVRPRPFVAGVHPTAVIGADAQFDPGRVCIGPCAVIEHGAKIGDGSTIGAGSFIGEGVVIGVECLLHPRVTVLRRCLIGDRVILHSGVVIGADGFGFETIDGRHQKVDQVGIVQIDDDVEIGANSCVDRARFGRTWVGAGTKIDNLVQIAHNVVIGKHCLIAGQAGIAGSSRCGDHVVIAAQAGVAGHLELASGVVLTAQSGVAKSLTAPGAYMGFHAQPVRESLRILAASRSLPDLIERVRAIEKRLAGGDDPA